MPFILPGMKGTDWFTSNEMPPNWRGALLKLVPDPKAKFTALTALLKQEPTDRPEFANFEKTQTPREVFVEGAHDSVTNTINLSSGEGYAKLLPLGSLIQNQRTGEIMRVDQEPSAPYDSVHVVRGSALGSTSAAMNAGDAILIVATAYEEKADVPTPRNWQPRETTNNCQIFRRPLGLSGTAMASSVEWDKSGPYKEAKLEVMSEHAIDMETAFLFGAKWKGTGPNGEVIRHTGGFFSMVSTHVVDFGGTATPDTWDAAVEQHIFAEGSDRKLALAGPKAAMALQKMAEVRSQYNITGSDNSWGITIKVFESIFGELALVVHPLLRKTSLRQGMMFVIDTDKVRYRYLRGRDTKLLKNRQAPGVDGRIDEFLTEAGLELQLEECHALVLAMDAFSAT